MPDTEAKDVLSREAFSAHTGNISIKLNRLEPGHDPCELTAPLNRHDAELRRQLRAAVEAKEKAERERDCAIAFGRDELERAQCERDEAVRAMDDGIRQNAAQVDRLVAERDEARATSQRQAVEIEGLRRAALLAVLNFERKLESGADLFDDDHEAWTALNAAMKEKP